MLQCPLHRKCTKDQEFGMLWFLCLTQPSASGLFQISLNWLLWKLYLPKWIWSLLKVTDAWLGQGDLCRRRFTHVAVGRWFTHAAAGREPVIYQVHLFTELLRVLLTWQLASHRMRHPKKQRASRKPQYVSWSSFWRHTRSLPLWFYGLEVNH